MRISKTIGIVMLAVILGVLAGTLGGQWWRTRADKSTSAELGLQFADSTVPADLAQGDTDAASIGQSRQNAITRAAARVGPAVVTISVVQTRVVPAQTGYDDFFSRFFFPRYYREQVRSMGSGVVVTEDGYILTNEHVTESADSIWVTLADGRSFSAVLVGSDHETDLAVLRVNGQHLPAARLGRSDSLLIGEWAIALGNPFGFLLEDTQPSVTVGVISAVDRDVKHAPDDERVYRKVIQTDAAINPGNSGGPLVNSSGDVVGINSFIFSSSRGSEGIGFAIPINQARVIMGDLVAYGEVRPAWVGVRLASVTDSTADAGFRQGALGVLVKSVQPGSPAEKSGLRPHDRIRKANRRLIRNLADWDGEAHFWRAGDNVSLQLDRDTSRTQTQLTLVERPLDLASEQKAGPGLWAVELSSEVASQLELADRHGAAVARIEANSAAARSGLEKGDVIRNVDKVQVNSVEDLKRMLARPARHLLGVERDGTMYVASLEP